MSVHWLRAELAHWPFAHLPPRPMFVLVVSWVLLLLSGVPGWLALDLDSNCEGAVECLLLAGYLVQAEQHLELVERLVQSCLELLHQPP